MDETISTLRIEIGASTEGAREEIDKLAESMKRLKSSSQSVQGVSRQKITVDAKSVDKAKAKVGALANILNSLKRIAFYRVIRSAIKAIGKTFKEGAENAYWYSRIMGNQTKYISEAYDTLTTKNLTMTNQLGAAWATLKAAITPILLEIVRLITIAANAVTQFFAILSGNGTYLKAIDYAKQWADATKNGAAAAKEWKNQLMGFDEINRLEEPSKGSGGTSNIPTGVENMFTESSVSDHLKKIIDTIKSNLTDVELFASGASLGLGLMLVASGVNVPLGLALVALGSYGLVKTVRENWDTLTENVESALTAVELVAAGLAFGIGAVLAFSGANVPLGLGLMASGLFAAANVVALNWNELPTQVKYVMAAIDAGLSLGMLAVGAVLAFSGANIPLGIALIAGGVIGLGVAKKLAWDALPTNVKEIVSEIVAIVSMASLALGAILAFSGTNIPLGIGLMAAGIAGLSFGVDWDALGSKVKDALATLFTIVTGALIGLGVVFLVTGNIPLGLGLLLAGGITGLATMFMTDENGFFHAFLHPIETLKEKFLELWGTVVSVWQGIADFFSWLFNTSESNAAAISANGSVYLQGFATGGFPEDGLFFANHNELVGQFNNGRTAVANNEQITEGIRDAVYDAFITAMSISGGNNGQPIEIYLDGNEIARSTTKYQRQFARAGGV